MTRRSATNPRYRKEAQVGKAARRSASSMKPKRESSSGASPAPAKKRSQGVSYVDPPEVKKWRIAWALLLGLALVPVAYVLGPTALKWAGIGGWPVDQSLARYGLYLEMAALGAALYIDFAIIRKLQTAAREAQKSGAKHSEKDAG